MKGKQQRLPDYLGHILEAIERIGRYTEDIDENGFLQDVADSGRGNPQS